MLLCYKSMHIQAQYIFEKRVGQVQPRHPLTVVNCVPSQHHNRMLGPTFAMRAMAQGVLMTGPWVLVAPSGYGEAAAFLPMGHIQKATLTRAIKAANLPTCSADMHPVFSLMGSLHCWLLVSTVEMIQGQLKDAAPCCWASTMYLEGIRTIEHTHASLASIPYVG